MNVSTTSFESLQERKAAIDTKLSEGYSNDITAFVIKSRDNLKTFREQAKQHYLDLAKQELDAAERFERMGDKTSGIAHSFAAGTYLTMAELA